MSHFVTLAIDDFSGVARIIFQRYWRALGGLLVGSWWAPGGLLVGSWRALGGLLAGSTVSTESKQWQIELVYRNLFTLNCMFTLSGARQSL